MRVKELARIDTGLLDELGVVSTGYYNGELERMQLAQRVQGTTRYVVARDASGRAVGMVPVYTTGPPWHPVVDPLALFALSADAIGSRLCLAGSHGTYTNFLTIGTSVAAGGAAPIARTLVERARAVAREAGAVYVMLPYLDQAQARWLAACQGTVAVDVREKAVLRVVWDSFEDYVASLPTARRTGVRRERRRFHDSGVDVREERVVDAAARLAPLLAQTEQRYGRQADPRQIAFHYSLLGMHLGDDFVALVAYRQRRPVACSLLLSCGGRLISKAWGCDYAAVGDQFLYFNLTFYEPIIRAIERGVEVLDYGLGSLESKVQRGCAVERLQTMLIASES